jgi:exosortase
MINAGARLQSRTWAGIALVGLFVWSYWPTLRDLFAFWQDNQDYSAGQFVPLIVGYMMWSRRRDLARVPVKTSWAGLVLLAMAQAIRFYGIYDLYGSLERLSVVLSIVGIVWFLLGTAFLLRTKWVLVFLLAAVPLPGRIHNAVAVPLQDFATRSAVFGLELLGRLVVREGNVLRIGEQQTVAVAEACSGLRMLNAFVVVCTALSFLIRRPLWKKGFVVLSAIPIAVAANTVRLVATVLLFEYASSETAEKFFHDFAGIVMMPFAVAAVMLELKLLDWLGPEDQAARAALGSLR